MDERANAEGCARSGGAGAGVREAGEELGDADLWAFKRAWQRRDLENVAAGRITQEQLSWFSGGKARRLKLINSPF